MNRTHVSLGELSRFLPEMEEMDTLRFALVSAAMPDPEKEWAASSAYATIDKRIIGVEGVTEALLDAEKNLRDQISELFATVQVLLRACYAGEETEAAQQLIVQGERYEQRGQLSRAKQFYDHALQLSLPLANRTAQGSALRHIGRVLLAWGHLAEAHQHYTRCIQVTRDTEDLETEINAHIGAGNALLRQGNRAAAEVAYHDALTRIVEERAEESLTLQRAQVYNNLAVAALRQDHIADAEHWLAKAAPLWETTPSPVDYAVFSLFQAELRLRQGSPDDARILYEKALTVNAHPGISALTAIDLAELCMAEGYVQDAVRWSRTAEDYAIAARSVDYLCYVYRGLGNIARDTGHEDGVAFYEKALDMARVRGLSFSEAQTLTDYAELRARADGVEEARAYLERARNIFLEVGATPEARRAEEALAKLGTPEEPESGEPIPAAV